MITLTKAISLLGKRVWAVLVLNPKYGRIERGVLLHVTIHADSCNRGEWHGYVGSKIMGWEYDSTEIFSKKEDAEAELKRRKESGESNE